MQTSHALIMHISKFFFYCLKSRLRVLSSLSKFTLNLIFFATTLPNRHIDQCLMMFTSFLNVKSCSKLFIYSITLHKGELFYSYVDIWVYCTQRELNDEVLNFQYPGEIRTRSPWFMSPKLYH